LLLLETSHATALVALADGDRLAGVRRLDEARRHARELAPSVADLLAAAGWRPRDLDGVVVGVGPGSYTGLRVGVMSAKALAFATGCALLAVPSFDAIARQAPAEVQRLHVLADAQQQNIYVQQFARGPDGIKAAAPLVIQAVDEWLPRLDANEWAAGPGLRKHRDRLPPDVRAVAEDLWLPGPQALLEIGLERYRRGERDDVLAVEPLYLRPSSAEEQWRRLGR
jgi:tRNA threonylcarbamoyladenosine biosynthesis protein TsaB